MHGVGGGGVEVGGGGGEASGGRLRRINSRRRSAVNYRRITHGVGGLIAKY